jgi:hypothetical protein
MEAEEARLVQELLIVTQEGAGILALLRSLAQRGHQGPRAAHRLVVVDAGEIAPGCLGKRSHVDHVRIQQGRVIPLLERIGRDPRRLVSHWGEIDVPHVLTNASRTSSETVATCVRASCLNRRYIA